MSEAILDLLLLSLVVLFFAIEQRRRPELYFRFWLAGWMLVLLSLLLWDIRPASGWWWKVDDCFRQDALVCGGLAFLFSFLVSDQRWRLPLRGAIMLAVPICLSLDFIVLDLAWKPLLYSIVLLGEWLAVQTARRYMRKIEPWFFPTIVLVSVGFGSCLLYAVASGRLEDVQDFVFAQLFTIAGMLYGRSAFRGGRMVGGIGFLSWGLFYALTAGIFSRPGMEAALFRMWSVPKYVAAIGMVLTIFEVARLEISRLSLKHQRLYEEYRLLFMSNPNPMWICEAAGGRFLAVNDAATKAYGFSQEEFLTMQMRDLELSPRDGAARHQRQDGTVIDVEVTDRRIMFQNQEARFVLAVDITERKSLHRELIRQAHHDALTGLPNRTMLDDRIEQCLSQCVREEKKGAVLTVDIDHFKHVNDTYGHLIGDECLKAAAVRLSSRVRQVDTIARTGGEEFTIVVGGLANRDAAEKVCSGMLELFETPVMCGEHELTVTVSIGVAMFPDHALNIEALRRRSDDALYEAKRTGRNRAVFASAVTL